MADYCGHCGKPITGTAVGTCTACGWINGTEEPSISRLRATIARLERELASAKNSTKPLDTPAATGKIDVDA